ncbi:MAG: hypothetical protein CMQ17_02640 [Gammaproteobacteria bacterium]|nr:hypothetical protein [Gammaproteobacteria bacterium]
MLFAGARAGRKLTASCLLLACSIVYSPSMRAEILGEPDAEDSFLNSIAEAVGAYGIDVTQNLNARDVISTRIQQPRLGRFPDLVLNSLPDSEEIQAWETAFTAGEISGLAILNTNSSPESLTSNYENFLAHWLSAPADERIFVSFSQDDAAAAEKIEAVLNAYGYGLINFNSFNTADPAGRLYATAAQRLAIDSREARRYRSNVTEFEYLGERVRRNSNSLFRDDGNRGDRSLARNEPSVFLKETLGDEYETSTIREIIVPGGVALGETANLPFEVESLIFADDSFTLLDRAGRHWQLPEEEPRVLKALFDFVKRSSEIQSDSIVDIDARGRVKISSALRDTDVGFEIMHADTQPFEYIDNLAVNKSVVIDIDIDWEPAADGNSLVFETDYEVRFLSADNMRIAQTRAALEYRYQSADNASSYQDSWGRLASRVDENTDFSGLGTNMNQVAYYAGWIGLFRKLHEDEVRFLMGRYEFMKVDKSGRETPSRY